MATRLRTGAKKYLLRTLSLLTSESYPPTSKTSWSASDERLDTPQSDCIPLDSTSLRRPPVFSPRAGPLGTSSANIDGSDSDWVARRQRHLSLMYHLTLSRYMYGSCLGGSAPCPLSAELIEWARREIQCFDSLDANERQLSAASVCLCIGS